MKTKPMKALVTGGAGFIGSHVVDLLISEGHEVVILDNLTTGRKENLNPAAKFIAGSIMDEEKLRTSMQNCQVVFHLAALPRIQPSFDEPQLHEEINVLGTIKLFEAARESSVEKIIFSSSSAVYGTPKEIPTTENCEISCLSPYALQKYTAEQYLLILGARFGLGVAALRYFNVYGPRSFNDADPLNAYSSVIGIFKNQFLNNQPLTITGDGEQRRDFVHVRDVAMANYRAALADTENNVFNVGCGASYSINEIAKLFNTSFKYIPERKGEARTTHADVTRAKHIIGWEPQISLEEGMAEMLSISAKPFLPHEPPTYEA